ncbi:MAG: hypothetical protein JWP97_1348 [Labilithrix sp.]|nr:hypothetical protein [Labilithrix sp.]
MNEAKAPGPATQPLHSDDGTEPSARGSRSEAQVLPPRIRRCVELVYAVDGVTAARVWHWPGHMAVGVRPTMMSAPSELLRRVEHAVAGLREPDETWDFGLLETDTDN